MSRVGHGQSSERPRLAIADIARHAGVSAMTVSRVLNGQPGVGEVTRARVRQIVTDLGYRPNAAAAALKRGSSRVIGYVSPINELRGSLIDTLFGVEQAARAHGWSVTVQPLDDLSSAALESAKEALVRSAVGVAVIVSPLTATSDALRSLADAVPSVGIWTPDEALPPVAGPDVELGAQAATEYLLQLGHATVAHVSGPVGWMATERHRIGWERALRAAGRTAPDPIATDWSADDGRRAGLQLLEDRAVTAVFAANDLLALGVMHAARDIGRTVPDDLSVIGYDDLPEASHYVPALTTVSQDFHGIGVRAFHAALARVGEESSESAPATRPPYVTVRESTAPPPSR